MQEIPTRVPYKALWIYIQHHFGPRRLEWAMAIITCTYGYSIYWADAFRKPAWIIFSRIFRDEVYLAAFMIFLGVVRLTGLIINGARKHATPQIRQISAGFGAFLWAGLTYCFYMSGDKGGWAGIFPFFFLFELDNIQQAARDQEHVKRYGRDY